MIWIISALAALVLSIALYVRMAPSPLDRWHRPLNPRPATLGAPTGQVVAQKGAAYVDLAGQMADFARLDAIIMATPRTLRLAGSVEAGRITYITRSRLWGFPDYTTAELGPQGITTYARLRFGRGDMGVNAARLAAWRAAYLNHDLSQN